MDISYPFAGLAILCLVIGVISLRTKKILAVGSILCAIALMVMALNPPREKQAAPGAGSSLNDDTYSKLVLGVWKDNYQGQRTMTLNKDGTGKMVVELEGVKAALFAKRLEFDMVWTVEKGRLKKKTVGGEPKTKVSLILKLMGDSVDEPILKLTKEELILLDKDNTTKYHWTR